MPEGYTGDSVMVTVVTGSAVNTVVMDVAATSMVSTRVSVV